MAKIGYLVLENGKVFSGQSVGKEIDVAGEVVFNTGMVGYPEGFTDPSYFGQILTLTYPLIGNYGTPSNRIVNKLKENVESDKIQIRGLIISSYIDNQSHWQSVSSLSSWLKKSSIPALTGIDTRTLTKIIREFGVMKAILTFREPPKKGLFFKDINSENLIPFVSCKDIIRYGNGKLKILFIDCGLKLNQIRIFLNFDTEVIRVPWNYNPFQDKFAPQFDTIFISNGPGDPRLITETVITLREAIKRNIPTFGICLGHQLLSLAAGSEIFKLKYGHRSQNQPVIDETAGKSFVTTQNHGYAVVADSVPSGWRRWFTNLNDDTNEGIHHVKLPFFSVQFHPEAAPGPTDTQWLFAYYIDKVNKWLKRQ